ncbi:UNKNOWN [Stylonychia lemnae]|uniref:Uncharacterized protein n=1 Tax=Stylonychia lemnae TaxID=5949 RepID=A0A078ASG3_STYLE|nr:UNKNOWN [Stylonychia lemnae]|eukprot:CDW84926.1 UNKNOWN [Stylonychia lemnae]
MSRFVSTPLLVPFQVGSIKQILPNNKINQKRKKSTKEQKEQIKSKDYQQLIVPYSFKPKEKQLVSFDQRPKKVKNLLMITYENSKDESLKEIIELQEQLRDIGLITKKQNTRGPSQDFDDIMGKDMQSYYDQQLAARQNAKTSYQQFKEKYGDKMRDASRNQVIQDQLLITELDDYIFEDKQFMPRVIKTSQQTKRSERNSLPRAQSLLKKNNQQIRSPINNHKTLSINSQARPITSHQQMKKQNTLGELSLSSSVNQNVFPIDVLISRPKSKLLSIDIDKPFIEFLTKDKVNPQSVYQKVNIATDYNMDIATQPRLNENDYQKMKGHGGFPHYKKRKSVNGGKQTPLRERSQGQGSNIHHPQSPYLKRVSHGKFSNDFSQKQLQNLKVSLQSENTFHTPNDHTLGQSNSSHHLEKAQSMTRFKFNMAYNNLKNKLTKEQLFSKIYQNQNNLLQQQQNTQKQFTTSNSKRSIVTAKDRFNQYKHQRNQQMIIQAQPFYKMFDNNQMMADDDMPIKIVQNAFIVRPKHNQINFKYLQNNVKKYDQDIQTTSTFQPSPQNNSYLKAKLNQGGESFELITNELVNETRLISDRGLIHDVQMFNQNGTSSGFKVSIYKQDSKINEDN